MKSSPLTIGDTARRVPATSSDGGDGPASASDVDVEMADLAALALETCQVPWAGLILRQGERIWTAHSPGSTFFPRDATSFCSRVAASGMVFEVADALHDPCIADCGVVTREPHIRFYAGVAVVVGAAVIGTLSVMGPEPRCLTDGQRRGLASLARHAGRILAAADAQGREQILLRDLHDQSDLSRSMIEAAGEAIISADLEGIIRSFNPAAERLLGYTAAEAVGRLPVHVLHDPAEVRGAVERMSLAEGRDCDPFEALALPVKRDSIVSQEWTYVRKDGSHVPVHLTISTRRDTAGEPTGFLAVARDLSEQRALRAETAINRAIIEHAGVAIIATSLTGTITAFNPAAQQLLGYTEGEMVGVATPMVFHDSDEVGLRGEELSQHYGERVSGFETFVRPLQDRAVDTAAWTYVAKDGHRIPVTLTVSVLRDDAGHPAGYLGVARDKTEHVRQLEREKAAAEMATIMSASQADFIAGVPPAELFERHLARMLEFTRSAYGFVGEVLHDPSGQPYLKTLALSNIAWSDETRVLYAAHKVTGFEFRNLQTLFGSVITNGVPVIANDPATDPRRGGLPPGHPAMTCFMGLPCYYGGALVAVIGLANRDGGYDDDLVTLFAPLTSSTASLVKATALEAERRASVATVADNEHRLRLILETAAECFIEVGPDGGVKEWNHLAEMSLERRREEVLGRPIDEVLRLRTPAGDEAALLECADAGRGTGEMTREVIVLLPSGRSFPAELVVWPVPSKEGTAHGAFLRDIADRKAFEAQQRRLFQSETLLKEVHHRIKNNMQVISSLLSIQASKLENERERAVFLDCRERIRAMSLIHDRLYATSSFAEIDLADFLREMLAMIVSSNKPDDCEIETSLEVKSLVVDIEYAVPLSLIASELVLNSLKHAFSGRRRGRIFVRLDQCGDACELFVGDDGPGAAATASSGRGIGMQLVASLLRQLRGSVSPAEYDSLPGTSVRWNAS